ncbi:kelch-like protein 9 [Aplysia californica]|uniref:Kelch-like protein 9 n=1 Tax=Aplysia californica TaxID=6500 RepID=A0ABM0JDM9_APLCA|nr:kelch-like protein 9 [Aplysia californica]
MDRDVELQSSPMSVGDPDLHNDDRFLFKSSDHGKSVLEGLQQLRQMRQLFDVTLVADSQEFPAHRVVLASCSDYFRAMFTDGLRESTESRISLNGLSATSTAHLIDFAYNSSINIDSDNVYDVLSGATHVQILPVISACENYLREHLTLDNCVHTAQVAELFSLHLLEQHVFNFICRNWDNFCTNEDFCSLTPQFLVSLLSSGYPVNCSESDVLRSVLGWFSCDSKERAHHMSSVLKCIMFQNLSDPEFDDVVNSNQWFELVDKCPNVVSSMPTLAKLAKWNEDFQSKDRKDKIISLTDFSPQRNSPISITRIEVRRSLRKAEKKNRVPGLVNTRGFHRTIVIAGGFCQDLGMTNNVLYIDSHTKKLKHLTKIPHIDQINFGVAVFCNQLYVVGGCFNDNMQEISIPFGFRYNPLLDEWRSIAPMNQERCRFLLCSAEDKIYAIGGDPFASTVTRDDVALCETYNPRTNEWILISSLPGNRSQLAGTSYGNSVFVSGGIQESEEQVLQDFYRYDPILDTWEKKADMLVPRADHSMFLWEGQVHVMGGWYLDAGTNRRVMATTIDCYDSDSDSWGVVGTLNHVRTYATYTLDGDCVRAIGGWYRGNYAAKCRTVDTFNLRDRTWSQGQEQHVALWEHGSCALHLPKFVPSLS